LHFNAQFDTLLSILEAIIRTVNSKQMQHLEQKLAHDRLLAELSCRARLNVAGLSQG